MEAKRVKKVVRAKNGGGLTEAAAVMEALAGEGRTKLTAKLAAESLLPAERKLVKKMAWDYIAKAVPTSGAAAACSFFFPKKEISPA